MPAVITSSPDIEDILKALSLYYFPDGSTEFDEVHVKLKRKDENGEEVTKLVDSDKFVIQFTGEQKPADAQPFFEEEGLPMIDMVSSEEDSESDDNQQQ